jgi:hypothetical protein
LFSIFLSPIIGGVDVCKNLGVVEGEMLANFCTKELNFSTMFFKEAYFANIFYLPLPRHRVGLMFLLMVYDGQYKLIFFYNLTNITMKLNSHLIRDLGKIIEKTQ